MNFAVPNEARKSDAELQAGILAPLVRCRPHFLLSDKRVEPCKLNYRFECCEVAECGKKHIPESSFAD